MSNLSTSDYKLSKSVFLAKFDLSALTAFLKSSFVAQLYKSNSNLRFARIGFVFRKYSLIYLMSFLTI